MNEYEKNEDVTLWSDATGWHCQARTHNWAGDFYEVHAKTRAGSSTRCAKPLSLTETKHGYSATSY
jgi:hypothetical protein